MHVAGGTAGQIEVNSPKIARTGRSTVMMSQF
jgi:hypothetical protein